MNSTSGNNTDGAGTSDNIQVQQPYQHQHHHNALDDMLNQEAVEEDEQDITCAEQDADNKRRLEFEASQNINYPATSGSNADGLGLDHTNTFSDPPSYDQSFGCRLRLHGKIMRHHGNTKVTNVELFFDLVFVYAISSISEAMVEHLTWEIVLQMLLITLAVWWAWVFSAWVFNWFNPDSYLVRLLLLALMLINLILSAVIHEAFTEKSLLFAGMYVLIQVGRNLVALIALHGHKLQKNFVRLLFWFSMTGILWIVGGAIGGTTRNVLWTVAIVLEYISAATGFYTPIIGRSVTTDWVIHGGHLAERCSLFIIIALGESIVVTGEAFREAFHEPAGVGMFIVSFVGAAAMWWIYFHTASTEALDYIERSNDPGKMGRIAYTYIHALMVIGIIWCAVADRISMEEPHVIPHHEEHGGMIKVAIMIGGPALFVLGHALFRRAFCSRVSWAHWATIAVFICATPIGIFCPLWATALTTTTILMLLAGYESYFRAVILPSVSHLQVHEEV
ncbi:MAG: putative membrane protein [Linnemannia gamsii]|nr:MAG: putative membrane protein [Linnemannia gamsii]